MKLALLILAAGLVLFVVRRVMELAPAQRRKLWRWTLGLGVVALLVGVSFRYGLHWLVVAGAALLAVLRRLLPLAISWLPLLRGLRRMRPGRNSAEPGAGGAWGEPPGGFTGGDSAHSEARTAGAGPRRGRPMSRREALQVLGLEDGASRADILQAYRDLIKRLHPDRGGPAYLAAKVNEAREVLLASQND